jgi:hypothetical protein
MDAGDARALMFRIRPDAFRDGVLLAASAPDAGAATDQWIGLLQLVTQFQRPRPPLSGRDLQAHGLAPGPDLGRILDHLIDLWIASDFTLTKADLLAQISKPSK